MIETTVTDLYIHNLANTVLHRPIYHISQVLLIWFAAYYSIEDREYLEALDFLSKMNVFLLCQRDVELIGEGGAPSQRSHVVLMARVYAPC